ncbi:hypothetical protein CCACVL1_19574, partial [Corchorus capsularis]
WEILQGTFSLSTLPRCLLFYLEGPCAGLTLLVRSVVITCSNSSIFSWDTSLTI